MKPAHKISVIVCTCGHGTALDRCLCALCGQDYFPYEIIVVDTAPQKDRTRQIVECFEGITYVPEYGKGIRFARRRSLSVASGDILACIDDDCIPNPQWLSGIARCFHDPQTACCLGPVLPTDTRHSIKQQDSLHRGLESQNHTLDIDGSAESFSLRPWILGPPTNIAVSRQAIERLRISERSVWHAAGRLIAYDMIRQGAHCVYEPTIAVTSRRRSHRSRIQRCVYQWGYNGVACLCRQAASDRTQRPRALRQLGNWFLRRLKANLWPACRHRRYPLDLGLLELAGGLTALPCCCISRLLAWICQTVNPEPQPARRPKTSLPLQSKP